MIEPEQPSINITDNNKVIDHEEFLNRIKKTLYYGSSTVKCTKISRPLADYAADIFSESHRGHSLSRLNFVTVGNLTVTPCSLILAMIYLDRLNVVDPAYARRITPSELFIVSMMVSTKFYCGYDEDIYLSAWAESGNLSVNHMKELELEFLDAIGWRVYVSNHEFFEKLKSVEKVLAKRQGLARGWLTYTELINFLPTMTLAKQILNYSTVIALSYTASVMTIAGAFFIASNVNVPGNLLFRGTTATQQAQSAVSSAGDASGGAVSEPSTPMQQDNCTSGCPISAANPSVEQSLLLKDCECSLQMAIEKAQLLNRAVHFNGTHSNYKAEFQPLPAQQLAPIIRNYGATISWKKFRFMYPMNSDEDGGGLNAEEDEDGNETETLSMEIEHGNRNCTYDEFIPLLSYGTRPQCDLAEGNGKQPASLVYESYKRTFEMFSSFLKFL
ncbi:uncharacterized protein LOC5572432 [Aedes aegypti]|uniref:Protein CNPPD1 n=1 Tax=Aedes aegypti TaxID=7159 RepID=A0A1S4F013_AEDAE|nr:uncharacterized protein LOC5572432 [Aedes aegypti]